MALFHNPITRMGGQVCGEEGPVMAPGHAVWL